MSSLDEGSIRCDPMPQLSHMLHLTHAMCFVWTPHASSVCRIWMSDEWHVPQQGFQALCTLRNCDLPEVREAAGCVQLDRAQTRAEKSCQNGGRHRTLAQRVSPRVNFRCRRCRQHQHQQEQRQRGQREEDGADEKLECDAVPSNNNQCSNNAQQGHIASRVRGSRCCCSIQGDVQLQAHQQTACRHVCARRGTSRTQQ